MLSGYRNVCLTLSFILYFRSGRVVWRHHCSWMEAVSAVAGPLAAMLRKPLGKRSSGICSRKLDSTNLHSSLTAGLLIKSCLCTRAW